MKLTSKQIFTYVALLGVIVLAAVYFLVYKKNTDLATATRDSNAALAVRVDSLKVYYDNEAKYLEEMEPMKTQMKEILEKYPADTQEEDIIMQAVHTQLETPVVYSNINLGEKSVLKSVGKDVVIGASLEEYQESISFVERTGTYVNRVTYANLKEAIQGIFDSEYYIGIKSIVYSAGEEDELNGTLELAFYSATGTGKEYTLPNILPYISGTENIFNNTEVEEEE